MNAAVAELTIAQKILVAALRLENEGHSSIAAEALTVACYEDDPHTFGLKGFSDRFPDSNKVLACLMGDRGLVRRGYLIKVGQKLYSLSRQGRDEAKRLMEGGDEAVAPKRRALGHIKVSKELDQHLVHLLSATATRRFKEGMKREITFRDASRFWDIAETDMGDAIDRALARVPATLAAVEQVLVGGSCDLSDGRSISQEDLNALASIHRFLAEQFSRHLAQQRETRRRF